MSTDLTEIIERTLREHAYLPAREYWNRPKCFCGEWQGLTAMDKEPTGYIPHARHAAEAVTAAITEHAEAVTDRFEYLDGRQVRRTIIRFPWKDVNDDEH